MHFIRSCFEDESKNAIFIPEFMQRSAEKKKQSILINEKNTYNFGYLCQFHVLVL